MRKNIDCFKVIAAVVLAVTMMLSGVCFATDEPTPAYYSNVEVKIGIVDAELKVNMRSKMNTDSDVLDRVEPGTSVTVLDDSYDEWVKVKYNGQVGYMSKKFVNISTYMEQVEVINEDPLEVTVSDSDVPSIMNVGNSFTLRGIVNSNIPMTSVKVELFDLIKMTAAYTAVAEFPREDGVTSYDLVKMDDRLGFSQLNGGEKRIIVTVTSANDTVQALTADFYVNGNLSEAMGMTRDCTFTATSDGKGNAYDANYGTCWVPESGSDTMTVTIPEEKEAGLFVITWSRIPRPFTLKMYNSTNQLLDTVEENNDYGMLHFNYELPADTKKITIGLTDDEAGITEIRVAEKDNVSPIMQQWEPVTGKVDLLVISAHQDDELLFFGGTIPYYAAQGKNVAVMYMANCARSRYGEAMAGLWACGLRNHPIFLGLKDKNLDSYEETVALWGLEETEELMVEQIRKYKPDVIVTHDINGEYGHNQHKLTSAVIRRAVLLAADPESYPDSVAEYGVWDVKKTYIHLYEGNQLTMEAYDEPMAELNGLTPTEVATIGYAKHESQHNAYSMQNQGVKYDNRVYGLIRTTVGDDEAKNDLFEHIED